MEARLRSVDETDATLLGGVCWVFGLDGLGGVGSGVTCPVPGLVEYGSAIEEPCSPLLAADSLRLRVGLLSS